jgi:hypothetical protein
MHVASVSYDLDDARWSAKFPAGDSPRTLVTAFGSPDLIDRPEVLVELARAYPRSLIIGCSSAGEIQGTTVRDRSLAVTIARFDRTDLQLVWSEIEAVGDSERAGGDLGRQLLARDGLRAVLVLGDGLAVNGAALARGLARALGDAIPITGGLAADGFDFRRTWLTVGGTLKRGIGAAVGFYGPHVVVGHGLSSDWLPQRGEWVITRCEGNFIHELDYQPAIDVYRTALADRGDELPEVAIWFPLSVRSGAGEPIVRTVIGLDEQEGALVLAGEVSQGQVARLLTADLENLIEGGVQAAVGVTKTGAPASVDCLALAISCFGRRRLLGSWSGEEIVAMRDGLHAQRTAVTGFYAYGQIAAGAAGPASLHNQTLSLTVLSEGRASESRMALPESPPLPNGYAVRNVMFDQRAGTWSAPLPDLDSPRTLVLVFGASELLDDRAPLEALRAHYPNSVIAGCSTAGEIHDATVHDRSLAVSITRFARTDVRLAVERIGPDDGFGVGQRLATALARHAALRGMIVLADGLAINGSELARGLNAVVGGTVPVVGGLAGDGTRFARTWAIGGGEMGERVAVAVGLYGLHVVIGHGVRGGWDRFGLKRTITRSSGNVLYELDGRPALQVYKDYLGDRARQLPASGLALPIAVRDPASDAQVVRTIVAIDEAAGSLTFAGDVPVGHAAQFMKADVERLLNGATHAALMANESGPPAASECLVVAISSAGRRSLLGGHAEEELEAIAEAFRRERARISGMYAYGELAPGVGGECELHNQTVALLVISEAMAPVARPGASAVSMRVAMEPHATPPPAPRPSPPAIPAPADPPTPRAEVFELTAQLPPMPVAPSEPSEPAGLAGSPEPAHGPIVRIPRTGIADVAVEESEVIDDVRVIRIRGKITESFKGEVAARLLRGRVILDLGDVQRITSFGVREWLAMFAGATELTECYLVRCAEAVAHQLTMIRAFDGGAKILSCFGPYLCNGCGKPFERLFDFAIDRAEISKLAIEQVRCPRCNDLGRFDDDPRSYFAFFGATLATPPDAVRARHAMLCAQDRVRPADEVEKVVDGDVTRVRVIGRLSLTIRWRRILENVDGALIVDLSAVMGVEPTGVQSLDFHLRQLPAGYGVSVEHAPIALVQRLVQRPTPQITVGSVVLEASCPTCKVGRTVVVPIAADLAGAAPGGPVTCKRCDGPLDVQRDPSVDEYAALIQAAAAAPAPAPAPAAAPAPLAAPAPRSRGVGWLVGLGIACCAGAALGLYAWRQSRRAPSVTTTIVELRPAAIDAGAVASPVADELPPSWADRPFTIDRDRVYLVGRSDAASLDEAISLARDQATARLLDQLLRDLAASPIHDFLAARTTSIQIGGHAIAAFNLQHGGLASFERVDAATARYAGKPHVFVRFSLPVEHYARILAEYRDVYEFRGMTLARVFPALLEVMKPEGNLVVLKVRASSWAAAARVSPGDSLLLVGTRPVTTVEELRTVMRSAWQQPDVRQHLTVEIEHEGARRRVFAGRPAMKGSP